MRAPVWVMITPRPRLQTGQALPLALVMLVAVAAIVFFMFNSGQLVQEKIRLTNTADAVAYSAGVFEARVLNYDAYTNRAMIANEIALGQAVGLASWAKYVGTAAENIKPYTYLIPAPYGEVAAEMLDLVKDMSEVYTTVLASSVVPMHDAVINALAVSQLVMHGPGNGVVLASRKQLMDSVAHANDPDAKVDVLPIADDFAGFVQTYSSREERTRMGRLVQDGRDAFLRSRNWDFGMVVLCAGAELRKRGSTEFIDLVDGWKSMDTLSAHLFKFDFKKFKCRRHEEPIGYGTAYSDGDLSDDAYSYAGSRPTNPRASLYADSDEGIAEGFDPEPPTVAGGAIPVFHELSEDVLKQEDPRTTLVIRVSKPQAKQVFSGGAGAIKPRGRLDLYQGALASGESAAVSGVEVFFERPDGKNKVSGKEETGSLFNPYWQARLAAVTPAQRVLAQLKQGLQLP
jgi:hypothetical protein